MLSLQYQLMEIIVLWNVSLQSYSSNDILLFYGIFILFSSFVLHQSTRMANFLRYDRFKSMLFQSFRTMPVVAFFISKEKQKLLSQLHKDISSSRTCTLKRNEELPKKGWPIEKVLQEATARKKKDTVLSEETNKMSGTIYIADSDHFEMCNIVYSQFAHANPLHSESFPSVCRMEAEIVSMTAKLLGGGSPEKNSVCGSVTSGGTESILTAIRASRDYMQNRKKILFPEMIIAISAHAAVYKAAEYFKIQLIRVGVDEEGRMKVEEVKKKINKNTILIYASAPSYPHGAIDPIGTLSEIAIAYDCCLHVDACLGGFVLPFLKAEISTIPFDFELAGVTSISVDTHKYGCAQKGSSVVLYSSKELRKFQYTSVMDWTGGLYISPSQPGSRSGGLISQTWAALVHMGVDGYTTVAREIYSAALMLRTEINAIPGLQVIGEDVNMIVAWKSNMNKINIYIVNDILQSKGWQLSVLQAPPALHLCITAANVSCVPRLVTDLRHSVCEVLSLPEGIKGGKAPIYGMAGSVPDRGVVGDLLKDIQDILTTY